MRYVLLLLVATTLLSFGGKDKKYADLKKKVAEELIRGNSIIDSIDFIEIRELTAQEFISEASEQYTFLIKQDSFDLEGYNKFLTFDLRVIRNEKEGSYEYKKAAEKIAKDNADIMLIENRIAAYKISRDSCLSSAKTLDNRKKIGQVCLVFCKWKSDNKDRTGMSMKYLFLDDKLITSWIHYAPFLELED